MKYNLFTPAIGPLNYPHCTMIKKGTVSIVTNPSQIVEINDFIYMEGDSGQQMGIKKVIDILEQRPARGEHSVDFIPVFQKLRIS